MLCSDIVGSTELYARLGDIAAHSLIAEHDELARRVVDAHGGRRVKGLGDGVLAVFSSPRAALAAAVDLQRGVSSSSGGPDDVRLAIRVGLSSGEVVEDDHGDVHGGAVIAASRITAEAQGGQILSADVVARLAGTVPGMAFRDLGPARLKGFDQPVGLCEVQWEAAPRLPQPRSPVGAGKGAEPFVGRNWEREEAVAAVTRSIAGRGELVLISGEPGIGKTRLAREVVADAAAAGCATVWTACWEGDDAPPYWPWMQLARSLREALDSSTDSAARVDRRALAVLVPELCDEPPLEAHDDHAAVRARLFNAVVDLMGRATKTGPLVVVFDDLHWADEPSLLLLRHLTTSLAGLSLSVIGTYRDAEVASDRERSALFVDLNRAGRTLRLAGLPNDELGVLVAAMTGAAPSDAVAAAITDRTGGNPLFVRELVRLLEAHGSIEDLVRADRRALVPDSARAVLGRRLAGLSAECRGILTAASVLGTGFGIELLAETTAQDTSSLVAHIDEAIAARVLHGAGLGRYRFAHDLFRDAVYDELTEANRAELHTRAGEALERARGRGHRVDATELAHHFVAASALGKWAKPAMYCREAGDLAMESLAYEDALRHYEQASECLDRMPRDDDQRGAILLSLATAAAACGDRSRSHRTCLEAAELARSIGSAELLARAALCLTSDPGGFEVLLFNHEQVAVLREALVALAQDTSPLRALVLARLSVALSLATSVDERRDMAEDAVALARASGDAAALAYALAAHCDTIAGPDDVERRLAEADEVVALAVERHDQRLQLLGLRLRVVALLEVGNMLGANATIESYSRLAAEVRDPLYGWLVPLWRGMRELMNGEIEACERSLEESSKVGVLGRSTNAALMSGVQRWFLLMETGEGAKAWAALHEVLGSLTEPGAVQRVSLALGLATAGQVEDARAHLDAISTDDLALIPRDSEWLPMLGELSQAITIVGGHPLARWVYDALHPHRHRFVVEGIGAVMLGSVDHYLGLLARGLGVPEEAAAHFDAALAAHRRMGASLLVDRTVRDAGAVVDDSRPQDATPNLFRHEGDYWTLAHAGHVARVKDVKGLHDIVRLLRQPGEELHVLDLATSGAPSPRAGAEDLHPEGDAGEVLDQRARNAYRERITDLEGDIEEAEQFGDPERVAIARAERDALVEELAAAYGLGGRTRRSGDAAERARSTVTRRIHDALRRIDQGHPELASHLRRSIKTGTFCVYEPDRPIDWQT